MSSIVTSGSYVAAKRRIGLSAKKVEGENGLKTVECLRGRLLSERVASKAANQEADNLGNKLIELENKLKEEVKWKNRAQKRLKSLMKKLEPMKLVYVVSDESSSHSTSFGKSESSIALSSSSSTVSLFSYFSRQPKDNDKKKPDSQISKSSECELDEPVIKNVSPTVSEFLNHTDIDSASNENQSFSSYEKVSCDKTISEKSSDDLQYTKFRDDVESDDHRSKSLVRDWDTCEENHQDRDETNVDNSMALVPVDIPATTHKVLLLTLNHL